ncbi:MAG: helix-turn-helix transcriptional regulator [Pseudorhizobium sp.]
MGQATKEPVITPALCRAARGMLDWTQQQLAERSMVSRSTIRDFEGCRHGLHQSTACQLKRTFEDAGVLFTSVEGCGPGLSMTPAEPLGKPSDKA